MTDKSPMAGKSGGFGKGGDSDAFGGTVMDEIKGMRDKMKSDEDSEVKEIPYQNLDKAAVLQECRVFHDATVVIQNPRKCCQLITKMLFLLVRGESFSSTELTDVFFGVTKLFQSKDVNLRRMIYLFIKEVAETCNPDDVIIVTSSLTKDMNVGEDLYRANAMRVLAKIIDATMLGAIERYFKQAIVDENSFVGSSALVAGLTLFKTCPDLVRRWINEVQEAVNSSSDVVQYHALSLLYMIKQHDRLAISKIVQQLSKGSLRSPLATCLLIRYTSSLMREDMSAANMKNSFAFLENCLRHKNDMVVFEAARAICTLPNTDAGDISGAITVLQMNLSSLKPSSRYAAIKILSEISSVHRVAVSKCNNEMENLLNDSNRSIATLAITTLLKTGAEYNIDRLMKQISSFMNEIGDDLKIIIVNAIRELCLKFPVKHRVMIGFLSTFLREEGRFDFKKSIVDSLVELMQAIPEGKEACLLQLCEFTEDCDYPELIIQILSIIGSVGPTVSAPSRYIRYVYNRIILESAGVRAAAVSALGSLAIAVPELRASIMLLLKRCLNDDDDEVRERSAVLLKTFEGVEDEEDIKFLLVDSLPMSFAALERSLDAVSGHANFFGDQPISFSALPIVEERAVPSISSAGAKKKSDVAVSSQPGGAVGAAAASVADTASALYKVPEFASYGRCFRSTASNALTENEMEYVVTYVKHVFENHIVLQFTIVNTIDDQRLTNAYVEVALDSDSAKAYQIDKVVKTTANFNEPAQCYVSIKRSSDPVPATCSCTLHFNQVQVNPSTGEVEGDDEGYLEEYPLESLSISTSDFVSKVVVSEFRRAWEAMPADGEVLEKFSLQFKKFEDAVNAVIDALGMQPVDGTATVPPPEAGATKRTHVIHLSGMFVGNITLLARAQLQMSAGTGSAASSEVLLKVAVRSESAKISQLIAESIQW